jgi:hypothetical protein
MEKLYRIFLLAAIVVVVPDCRRQSNSSGSDCADPSFFRDVQKRNFLLGVTTWPYDTGFVARQNTYSFISNNTEIYSEQIDNAIPWKAIMAAEPWPAEYLNNITDRANRRVASKKLLLSVSLLNISRNDLMEDVDGTVPSYTKLSDTHIRNAYINFLITCINMFDPDYLVVAMEVNELLIKSPVKWNDYRRLVQDVRLSLRGYFPSLPVSESITVHGWYEPDVTDPAAYLSNIDQLNEEQDFVSLSYYPFLKGQRSRQQFQEAFNFIHQRTDKPIAFVETSHLAEDLNVPALNVNIEADECEQAEFLKTLAENAQSRQYLFVIWWAHRDYDKLWTLLPAAIKDVAQLWRDTGLFDEAGRERASFSVWKLLKAIPL